jgi:hypothetical protein
MTGSQVGQSLPRSRAPLFVTHDMFARVDPVGLAQPRRAICGCKLVRKQTDSAEQ